MGGNAGNWDNLVGRVKSATSSDEIHELVDLHVKRCIQTRSLPLGSTHAIVSSKKPPFDPVVLFNVALGRLIKLEGADAALALFQDMQDHRPAAFAAHRFHLSRSAGVSTSHADGDGVDGSGGGGELFRHFDSQQQSSLPTPLSPPLSPPLLPSPSPSPLSSPSPMPPRFPVGIPPDAWSYSVVIRSLSKEERWGEAVALWDGLLASGCRPSQVIQIDLERRLLVVVSHDS